MSWPSLSSPERNIIDVKKDINHEALHTRGIVRPLFSISMCVASSGKEKVPWRKGDPLSAGVLLKVELPISCLSPRFRNRPLTTFSSNCEYNAVCYEMFEIM